MGVTTFIILALCATIPMTSATIVQTLSSRYAVVLGGYGPGYTELKEVEVVKHDGVCRGSIRNIPSALARFLGDVSGLAEFVSDKIMFCRHSSCWRLDLRRNSWERAASLKFERDQAASVSLGDRMVVIGGQGPLRNEGGLLTNQVEVYNATKDSWELREDLAMEKGRFSFCAVPVNSSALMVLGGWGQDGPLDSVEMLDMETGAWRQGPPLPKARYGHTCLLTEVAGSRGVMVAGGALTGNEVVFLDLETMEWRDLPSLNYKIDGHKLILVEGIPTLFSWENIEQFDGKSWTLQEFRLSKSRSAFTVTSVPGHLVRGCR